MKGLEERHGPVRGLRGLPQHLSLLRIHLVALKGAGAQGEADSACPAFTFGTSKRSFESPKSYKIRYKSCL